MDADPSEYQRHLSEVRASLDAIDRRLVALLRERADVIARVVALKQEHGLGPVDLDRERAMLARIEDLAVADGLDPRIARQVLEAVIKAFTAVEADQLGD